MADNAKAFQKAISFFETQGNAVENDAFDDVDVEEGDENDWQIIQTSLEKLSTEGIFCVRCGAHSLQLVCTFFWVPLLQNLLAGAERF